MSAVLARAGEMSYMHVNFLPKRLTFWIYAQIKKRNLNPKLLHLGA